MNVVFTIPGPPRGKGRARIGRIGSHARMFTPAKTVAYEGLVALAGRAAMSRAGVAEPMGDAVACVVHLDCQVPASWSQRKQRAALAGEVLPTSKPDADNVVKALFDGCNGVVWRDDAQVVDLRVVKRYAVMPCVRMEVRCA